MREHSWTKNDPQLRVSWKLLKIQKTYNDTVTRCKLISCQYLIVARFRIENTFRDLTFL